MRTDPSTAHGPVPVPAPVRLPVDMGLDVTDYLRAAWDQRRIVVVAGLLFAGLGALWSVLTPRRYEAMVTIAVVPSKLAQPQSRDSASVANFVPVLVSNAAVAPLIEEFNLSAPPLSLTPMSFMRRALSVRPLPETNLLRVIVELDTPERAAKVGNRLVEHAIALSRSVNAKEIDVVLADLKALLDQAEARMRAAEARYDEYRRTAQLERLRKDVETLLLQRGDYRRVIVELAAARGRVLQSEAELAKRQQLLNVKRRIDQDPTLLAAAQERAAPGQGILGLSLSTEYVSGVYEDIDAELAKSRAVLTSLERQRDQLVRDSGVGDGELRQLNQLYEHESALSRLELERTIVRKSFEDVAARYQTAQLEAIGKTSQVLVVDAAVPPELPVSRMLARNVALGIVAGLLLGLVLAAFSMLRLAAGRAA